MSSDLPLKPRRKKLDVLIHKTVIDDKNDTKASNECLSPKKPKQKDKSPKAKEKKSPNLENHEKSKKYLIKENARLVKENDYIIAKFNELEELSVKKITKLKEKIATLQNFNEKVAKDNLCLKEKSHELLEATKRCQSCEELKLNLQQLVDENNNLKTTRRALEEDLNMLKTVVYRLNVQMERYQEKLRNLNITIPQTATPQHQSLESIILNSHDLDVLEIHKDHSHTPISWGAVNAHTLGPLLDAYQDTINEKNEIIESYEREIYTFTGKLKDIIRENEALHQSLTEDSNCSLKLKEEIKSLSQELKTLKEQNDVLIKKCALKQDKLQEVLQAYEHRVEQLKRDYSVVYEQYCKSRTEAAALKESNKVLIETQDEFKSERQNYIPLSVHTASVNECKKWYEELKQQYEQEKLKMQSNLETQTKLLEESERKIAQHIKQKEELETNIKQLEKQIKKGEAKYLELEHTLSEIQFAKSACKKQLTKAMNFAKDLVAEQEILLKALNQRQEENKVVKKIGCDIATRMDTLRSQLKCVQKEAWQELSTVEKKIQDQNEALQTMKQEHNEEIERLQKIIKEQECNILLTNQSTLPVSQYLLFKEKHK